MDDETGASDSGARPLQLTDIEPGLLGRYLAGEATLAERTALDDLLTKHPDVQAGVDWLRSAVGSAGGHERSARDLARWAERIRRQADAAPPTVIAHPRPARIAGGGLVPWARQRAFAFATGALAAAAILVLATRAWIPHLSRSTGREYATTLGQRETVTLADGTRMTLAPGSRVRLDAAYGAGRRDLTLVEGEAYFVVQHDSARPFAVHAGRAVARDIGTRFDVRSYASDHAVRVVVAEGAVSLSDTARGAGPVRVLGRGALGTVTSVGMVTVAEGIDADRYVAWSSGRLAFSGMPLADVLADLSRWYNVDIRLGTPSLGAHVVTTSLREDERLDDAIADLAATFGVSVTRHAGAIVFAPAAP